MLCASQVLDGCRCAGLALEDQGTVIVERGNGTRTEALPEQNCMSRCNEGFRGLSKGNGFSSFIFNM